MFDATRSSGVMVEGVTRRVDGRRKQRRWKGAVQSFDVGVSRKKSKALLIWAAKDDYLAGKWN